MSLYIRRTLPCLALIATVLVAACSGGDPVSPARSVQVPSLGKASTDTTVPKKKGTGKDSTTATTGTTTGTASGPSKCSESVETESGGSTTPTDTSKSTKRCETAPWW